MTTTQMSAAETVHAFLNAVTAFDYDAAMTLISEGCEYENMPMGKAIGPAGVRGVLEPFFSPTLENEFLILRELTNGNAVFTERLDRHRLATGWVELPVAGVWEVENGLITAWREYFDAATILSKWPAP
ncbi:limonene-1,2-epoxide hydrolase family protein [Hyphomonas sp.]|jgi:limonene-1,2-epoxide hydrolase|uniref:limonene-1,2-epoxide hydrolase family protein n=1 Tax=Hyphomonas sp. TaxID=87 RepID=UPI0025C68D9D|nr:limonene-1,2-epoxide hydrolase family protein [Hyphomonas sp.]